MDPDTSLVVALALSVLAIPAMVSAYADGRSPRVSAIVLVLAGGLAVYAFNQKPGGYQLQQIPDVVYDVIGRLIG